MSRTIGSGISIPEIATRRSGIGGSVEFLGANDVLALGIDDTDTAGDIVAQLTRIEPTTVVVLGAGTDSRLFLGSGFLKVAAAASFTEGEDVQVDVIYTTGIDVDMISILLTVVEVSGPVIDPRVYLPGDIPASFPRNEVLTANANLVTNNATNKRFVNALASS